MPAHRIPSKTLNADNLAEGIKFALADSARTAAKKMGEQIRAEVRRAPRSRRWSSFSPDVLPRSLAVLAGRRRVRR